MQNIHQQFVKLGNDRRKLTNELLALLPEIYKSRIYRKYAASIVEYAAKFGGLSKGVVLKRLRLEKHVKGMPALKEAIRSEGINKVAIMATLVTPENEEAMVDKIKNMSKPALQELAKELRSKNTDQGNLEMFEVTRCQAVPSKLTIELDEEMTFMFLKIKKELKLKSNREVMQVLLKSVKSKTEWSTSVKTLRKGCFAIPGDSFSKQELETKAKSRYIPAKDKKAALQKTNNHCAYPNCNRPPEVFHHADRYANSHSHKSIQPLCKIHHEFAHNALIKHEQGSTKNWQLEIKNGIGLQKIDQLYRSYRSY